MLRAWCPPTDEANAEAPPGTDTRAIPDPTTRENAPALQAFAWNARHPRFHERHAEWFDALNETHAATRSACSAGRVCAGHCFRASGAARARLRDDGGVDSGGAARDIRRVMTTRPTIRRCLSAAALAAALAAPSAVRADLSEEADINAGLVVIAAGNMIRKRCPEIEARMVLAFGYMRELKGLANERGYTDAVIRAYVEDDAAKDVVEDSARAYLAARGLGAGSATAHCRVGRAEIAAGTQIGRLLRAR